MDPRAGTPAQPSDLVDLDALVGAYYDREPDLDDPAQQRGVRHQRPPGIGPRHGVQRGAHRRDHRRDRGVPPRRRAPTVRCSSAATRTRCPTRPGARALEVLAAADVEVHVDARDSWTPTPGVSHAILRHNGAGTLRGRPHAGTRPGRRHRRDAVAQPAARRRLQVQPAARRAPPARTPPAGSPTAPTRSSRPAGRSVPRVSAEAALAADTTLKHDYLSAYVADLANVIDVDAIRVGRRAHRRGPAGRRVRRVLGRDRRVLRARPHRGEPDGRPAVGVHDARLGRQDPDGLLVAVRDGLAGQPHGRATRRRSTSRPATTPTPTGTASSRPTG